LNFHIITYLSHEGAVCYQLSQGGGEDSNQGLTAFHPNSLGYSSLALFFDLDLN